MRNLRLLVLSGAWMALFDSYWKPFNSKFSFKSVRYRTLSNLLVSWPKGRVNCLKTQRLFNGFLLHPFKPAENLTVG